MVIVCRGGEGVPSKSQGIVEYMELEEVETGISKAFKRLDYEGKENGVECRSSFFFFFFKMIRSK